MVGGGRGRGEWMKNKFGWGWAFGEKRERERDVNRFFIVHKHRSVQWSQCIQSCHRRWWCLPFPIAGAVGQWRSPRRTRPSPASSRDEASSACSPSPWASARQQLWCLWICKKIIIFIFLNTHTKKTKGLIRRTAEGRSLLTFRFVSKKLVHFLCGSVIHANHEAVVVHVEDEVLAL